MSKQSDLVSVSQGASGDPLFIDTANDRVGVGTSSPAHRLHVAGNVAADQYHDSRGVITATASWGVTNNSGIGYPSTFPYRVKFEEGYAELSLNVYLGTTGSGNARYLYWDIPTGSVNWMDFYNVEVASAGWSWGQTAGYRRWTTTSVANSWVTTLREDNGVGTLTNMSVHAVPQGSTSVRFGFSALGGGNSYSIRIGHIYGSIRTAPMIITDTNPF